MDKKTDNSALEEKVVLRLNSLERIEKDTVNVLECFGGEGVIWSEVRQRTIKKVNSIRIDVRYGLSGFYLRGDNLKYLSTIDLRGFDIIDLDAYGSPFKQLEIIFRRGYRGIIHCTFIQSGMGMLENKLLEAVGYNKSMIRKAPSLFNKSSFGILSEYLYLNGINKVQLCAITREKDGGNANKYYFWFEKV